MSEIIHLSAYAAKQTAYQEAVRELAAELESWSCHCVGMALALRDLCAAAPAAVGTVAFNPERELALCADPRVKKMVELSALLHRASESIISGRGD